jgi:hypothetical protein
MLGKLEAIGAKGIRNDQLRASFNVRPMDLGHRGGMGKVKFIKAFVKSDAARVEHGAHRAVGENRFCGESVKQARQSCG